MSQHGELSLEALAQRQGAVAEIKRALEKVGISLKDIIIYLRNFMTSWSHAG